MCLILDTNTFAQVFNRSNDKHNDFEPVLNWIINGNAVIVYGGSTYMKELKMAKNYFRIFNLLSDIDKTRKCKDGIVDREEEKIASIIDDEDFDDKHLAAIVNATKCRVICTKDSRSFRYLKDIKLYNKNIMKPLFYTSRKNADLLCEKNIISFCKPCGKLSKKKRELFLKSMNDK